MNSANYRRSGPIVVWAIHNLFLYLAQQTVWFTRDSKQYLWKNEHLLNAVYIMIYIVIISYYISHIN